MKLNRTIARYLLQLFLVTFVSVNHGIAQERPLQPGTDVLHYDFSLAIPDSGRNIEGLAVITIRRSQPITHFVLDLIGLRVDTVWVNHQ